MVSLTIRDVDEELRRHIRFRAAANGTSMQTEMRMALRAAFITGIGVEAVTGFPNSMDGYPAFPPKQPPWVDALADNSLGLGSFDDVPVPERIHTPRFREEWIR